MCICLPVLGMQIICLPVLCMQILQSSLSRRLGPSAGACVCMTMDLSLALLCSLLIEKTWPKLYLTNKLKLWSSNGLSLKMKLLSLYFISYLFNLKFPGKPKSTNKSMLELHWVPLTTSKKMQKKLLVTSGCSL